MMSKKRQIWLNEYLKCWNATEAARRAGYKWPNRQGSQLLGILRDEVDRRIQELTMSADEVLTRLAEHARGSLGEFSEVTLLEELKTHPKAHLVKKLTTDVHESAAGKIHYKTHIELHDAQAALVHLAKVHGLFTDRIEHSGEIELKGYGSFNPDDWDDETIED